MADASERQRHTARLPVLLNRKGRLACHRSCQVARLDVSAIEANVMSLSHVSAQKDFCTARDVHIGTIIGHRLGDSKCGAIIEDTQPAIEPAIPVRGRSTM